MLSLRWTVRSFRANETQILSRVFLSSRQLSSSGDADKALLFFEKKVQDLLKNLTRVDMEKVFRKRKDGHQIEAAVYKFMTSEQLEKAIKEAEERANQLLQMPPVMTEREEIDHVFDKDPRITGVFSSDFVFTDISPGKTERSRMIVVREKDGTLRSAKWEERNRMNQIYFPRPARELWVPVMFQDENLKALLKKKEYTFILDRACAQFEPDDPDYIRVTTKTYEAIDSAGDFNMLRSTRHFGPLVFRLALSKNLDNLILENLETDRLEDAAWAIQLYNILHPEAKMSEKLERGSELEYVKAFIDQCSNEKSKLELAFRRCKDYLSSPESAAMA